ncbi:MAG: hypothetical protein CVU46_11610 [Chloroflexi bacterium HGW-Chloroflexi-8]|nr:MAG: hypothetical protein CVU46_11610 [Chloroflexi bacterium HGW-Chloroflexi-8]
MNFRRNRITCLVAVLVILTFAAGCGNKEKGEALAQPLPSPVVLATQNSTVTPTLPEIVQATPTLLVREPLFDPSLDLKAGPVEVPLELQIPALKVQAPVLGVGLTADNNMDAPKGPIGDPVWHTAFWYRGGVIPGEPGTATIAGHVNDPLGVSEIFANLQDLKSGDLIIVRNTRSAVDIRFVVDQVEDYSIQESADPAVLARIFGVGTGTESESLSGQENLSRLTLITCSGTIVNGVFDHHTVVFATRIQEDVPEK